MWITAILSLVEATPEILAAIQNIIKDIRGGNTANAKDLAAVQAGLNTEEVQAQTDMLNAIARRKAAGL